MFSFRERFIANETWLHAWQIAAQAISISLLVRSIEFSFSALRSPLFLVLTCIAVVATATLTLCVASFMAVGVFGGMTEKQVQRNGGPFAVGDRVLIIAGRNSGTRGTATSHGQGGLLRITSDAADNPDAGYYAQYQLKRDDSVDSQTHAQPA